MGRWNNHRFLESSLTDDENSSVIGGAGEHHHSIEVVILAPFLVLAIGAFLRQTTKNLAIPYTLQLLVLGSILGAFLRNNKWDDSFQKSFEILGNMDPHLMLHIFLPPLVFESAASLDWHIFTQSKCYMLILAGPGLVAASIMTGFAVLHLMKTTERFTEALEYSECPSYAWSFPTSVLLGVIMSATDPVAVVALLKDLGCKDLLATTIEGESLLNDGTALVMYTILIKIAEGDSSDNVGDYLVTFIKMSIGGASFGLFFAFVVVQWLRMVFNDPMTEITITLSAAYLCFFIAEYFLHVSGVLAVVCMGLYFGVIGRTSVSPEVAHFLEEFWQCLGYIGNTLIFVTAGTVIGYKLPVFPASEFIQMFAMYLICALIRALVIALLYISFKVLGADIEYRDQVIATWAGLRGAVGLSLAMMVFYNTKICEPVREIIMFHTAGIVVLTVCINSITMPYLVKYLGLDTVAPSKQVIYHQAMEHLTKSAKKQETSLRADHLFDSTIWDEARKYYFHVEKEKDGSNTLNSDEVGGDPFPADKEFRRRVLMIMKKSYWRQFQDGLLSDSSVRYLIHHTDIAIDDNCQLYEWETFKPLIQLGSTLDHGTDKLVALDTSSIGEKRRVKILNVLDSIPVLLIVLLLVLASCILPFVFKPDSIAFFIIENTTTTIFTIELIVRLYCLQDWKPCAVDPYIGIDIIAVLLDIALMSTEDFLGGFSEYSKSIRSIRFLRLFRLLRLARVAYRLNKAKVAAINEPSTLLETNGWVKMYQKRFLFSQLKNGYEISSAFKVAREEALLAIKHIESKGNILKSICRCIEDDIKEVHSALLDVQRLYNEIAASITTSLAARTVLNKQRHAILSLHKEGLLDLHEHKKLKGSVEYQMKKLAYHPPIVNMPNKLDILRQIEWLECIDRKYLPDIAFLFEDAVFQRGDTLVKQGEQSDSVFILARGTVAVSYASEITANEEVNVVELGMGSIFGEIAWVLNRERGATIKATSPGLIFSIKGSKLHEICHSNKELENNLWETCGRRLFENALVSKEQDQPGTTTTRQQIRDFVNETEIHTVDPINKKVKFYNYGRIMLLKGTAIVDTSIKSKLIEAPNLLPTTTNELHEKLIFQVEFSTDAKFMCHKNLLSPSTNSFEDMTTINVGTTPNIVMELKTSQNILSGNLTTSLHTNHVQEYHAGSSSIQHQQEVSHLSADLVVPLGSIIDD